MSGARILGQEPDPEEQKQLAAIARFVTVLEKNPRRGTALDRVYGHHVEFGTLDAFVSELTARAANSAGEHWMILGMIEYQRGSDAQAVEAFKKSESLRTKDPLASYYLGQAQIRIGDSSVRSHRSNAHSNENRNGLTSSRSFNNLGESISVPSVPMKR